MKLATCAVAFLFVSAAAVSAAHADEAGETLVRSLIGRIDASPDWAASASGITSDGGATLVESLKIGREDGSGSIEIGKIRADGLAPNGDGGFALSAFTVGDVTAGGHDLTISIPGIKGGGFRTKGTTGWQFDPQKPASSVATLITQLVASEFDEITIPSVSFEVKIDAPEAGPKLSGRYTDFRIGPLKGGILVSESVARTETTGAAAAGDQPVTSVMEGIEAKNIDLGAFARLLDSAAYGAAPDRNWKRMEESISYAKVTTRTGERGEVSFGPVTMRDFDVRQTTVPLAPALDALLGHGEPSEAETLAFLKEHASDLVGWFRLGSISMSGLLATPPEGGKIALASASLEGLSADGLKRFALAGFSAEVAGFTGSLKSFEIADIVWPKLATFLAFAELSMARERNETPDPALVAQIASDVFNVVPYLGRFTLSGISFTLLGAEPLTLDTFELTNEGGTALLPKLSQFKLLYLVVPRAILNITPESAEIFAMLGYDRLEIYANGRGDYDGTAGHFAESFRAGAKQAGVAILDYSLGGLTPGSLETMITPFIAAGGKEPDPATLMTAFGPLTFEGVQLRFEDESLTRRVLAVVEKMQKVDEATLIGNVAAVIQLALAQIGNQRFTDQVVGAVSDFLKNPKSFTVSLKPPAPISISRLLAVDPNNPGAAVDLLGASVSAND
ncbi:hypothetical protein BH10PSE7_BH10PSE7_02440 [soil metagenome]